MPRLTYAENPVHPVINDLPAALVPVSVAFDMLHLVTRRGSFKAASFWTLLFATITGVAAALTGYRDYREIPEHTEPKRLANTHALLSVGVLGALVVQLVIRVTGHVGLFARLLNVAAAAGLVASGWYGTHLVYRHGLRVRGVDPLAGGPDDARDTGKPFADRLESFASMMPDTDLGAGVRARMDERMRAVDLDADSPAAGSDLPSVEDVMSDTGDAR